jgi:hypothetical protein
MCQLSGLAGAPAPYMYAAITQCRVIHLPSHAVQPILVNHHSLIEKVCIYV